MVYTSTRPKPTQRLAGRAGGPISAFPRCPDRERSSRGIDRVRFASSVACRLRYRGATFARLSLARCVSESLRARISPIRLGVPLPGWAQVKANFTGLVRPRSALTSTDIAFGSEAPARKTEYALRPRASGAPQRAWKQLLRPQLDSSVNVTAPQGFYTDELNPVGR